jgi:hypothetical protein
MEGEHQTSAGGAAVIARPNNYVAMAYAPVKKLDTEEKLETVE